MVVVAHWEVVGLGIDRWIADTEWHLVGWWNGRVRGYIGIWVCPGIVWSNDWPNVRGVVRVWLASTA